MAPSTVPASLLGLVVAASLVSMTSGSSMHIASLCSGGQCQDPKFPILDFDQEKGECICRAHPCWDNKGVSHSCPDGTGFPFLHFSHSQEGELMCSCNKFAVYESLHLSRDLCPGHTCDNQDFPVMDFDAKEKKCICRSSPCSQTVCPDGELPHYGEDKVDGESRPRCECLPKQEKPQISMRGSAPKETTTSCTWIREQA